MILVSSAGIITNILLAFVALFLVQLLHMPARFALEAALLFCPDQHHPGCLQPHSHTAPGRLQDSHGFCPSQGTGTLDAPGTIRICHRHRPVVDRGAGPGDPFFPMADCIDDPTGSFLNGSAEIPSLAPF